MKSSLTEKFIALKGSCDDVISVIDDFFINGIQPGQYWRKKFVDRKGYYVVKST